ncbi:MAG: nitroreductase [Chromatiales bacterium]|nr:nitroreductase [Chromatiales bacterium]
MNVSDAIKQRKSVRAFLPREVERSTIEQILDTARHAPSGGNLQPWQVAVVSGERKRQLEERLEQACRSGEPARMAYQYYPLEWPEPYKGRRVTCGLQLYSALGIERGDRERKLDQWAANFRAFDAPVMLFFFIDPTMETGAYVDMGIFLQSVMLAAEELGLATCAQAALGEYPEIVKQELGYGDEQILVCGMALGYEDKGNVVNGYRTEREGVEAFTRFFD